MNTLVALAQTLLLIIMALPVFYLLLLMVSASFYRSSYPRTAPSQNASKDHPNFVILIPAHDEALTLPASLAVIKALPVPENVPVPLVVVVADNCSDNTADLARQAGVIVLERHNQEKRGKGYALEYAIDYLLSEYSLAQFNSLVIFDADTLPDQNFLKEACYALQSGQAILQGCYDILKPAESRRTRLLYTAFVIYNHIRPLGRAALGLSDGLRGNGMVFRREVLEAVPWKAFGLVEDIEYANRLVLSGRRVLYVPQAKLYGQAPGNRQAATTQRMRWESGRFSQARHDLPALLGRALRRADFNAFDRAMDLLIPPLALLAMLLLGLAALDSLCWFILGGGWLGATLWGWLVLLGSMGLFVIGSLVVARAPGWAYLALLSAPVYIVWKLQIYLRLLVKRAPDQWERTQRVKIDLSDLPPQTTVNSDDITPPQTQARK